MPIINDAVRSSSSSRGFGLFSSDHLNSYDASLIKNISRNERRRWRGRSYSADLKNYRKNGDKRKGRDQIIPRQVLTIFWEWGIKFTAKPPSTGMGLRKFLVLLRRFADSCKDRSLRETALYLYEDTVRSELMPNWKNQIKPKKSHYKRFSSRQKGHNHNNKVPKKEDIMEEYLTTKELSERIKMAPGTIRNLIWKNKLKLKLHYIKPTPRKILFIWSRIKNDFLHDDNSHLSQSTIKTESRINI